MPNSNFWTYPFGLKKPATPNFWSGNAPATLTNSPSLSGTKYPFSITGRQAQPFGAMAPITSTQNKSFMPLDRPIRAPWYQPKPTPVTPVNNRITPVTTPNTDKNFSAPDNSGPWDMLGITKEQYYQNPQYPNESWNDYVYRLKELFKKTIKAPTPQLYKTLPWEIEMDKWKAANPKPVKPDDGRMRAAVFDGPQKLYEDRMRSRYEQLKGKYPDMPPFTDYTHGFYKEPGYKASLYETPIYYEAMDAWNAYWSEKGYDYSGGPYKIKDFDTFLNDYAAGKAKI